MRVRRASDGDTREMHHPQADEFRQAQFVHEAITADPAAGAAGGKVRFYLTRSPYCSSTLRPNTLVTAPARMARGKKIARS